jgi:hypothetical protein
LKTRYAQNQIQKFRRGTAQTGFLLEDADQIVVPKLSEDFCKIIANTVSKMDDKLKEASAIYAAAENRLLSELGMNDYVPLSEPVAIKSFSKSFGETGRLDAEYYQEKYEKIEIALNMTESVAKLCHVHDKAFVPHKGEYKYIELSDVGMFGNVTGCMIAPYDELPSRARRLVRSGQVIVSSIEGSLSSCALITDEYDGGICSTGFYVVSSDNMNSETLLVLFKSAPVQAMLKKRCSGTILTAINRNAFDKMPLPIVDDDTQMTIATYVQQAFALRRESEHLLDAAIQAVEFAIEVGEDYAISWLNLQKEVMAQ